MSNTEQLVIRHIDEETHDIYLGDTKIGYAELGMYPTAIVIENIEFNQDYQDKGYGTQIVNQLKHYPNITEITGESHPDSLGFWRKCGAVFNSTALDAESNGIDLIPFVIKC